MPDLFTRDGGGAVSILRAVRSGDVIRLRGLASVRASSPKWWLSSWACVPFRASQRVSCAPPARMHERCIIT
jgi:hypothetical protein